MRSCCLAAADLYFCEYGASGHDLMDDLAPGSGRKSWLPVVTGYR